MKLVHKQQYCLECCSRFYWWRVACSGAMVTAVALVLQLADLVQPDVLLTLFACRCRWLRTLLINHAVFHTALRRLPPEAIGAVIMHLPAAWRRLQYLAESAQENAVSLMDAVQMYDGKFTQVFPEYAKWRCWTDGHSEPQVRVV